MKSSSTEHLSGGNDDLGGIERDYRSRGAEACSSPNVHMETTGSKKQRDLRANRGPQDEEEERGIDSDIENANSFLNVRFRNHSRLRWKCHVS